MADEFEGFVGDLDLTDISQIRRNIFDRIERRSKGLIDKFKELDRIEDMINDRQLLYKLCFVEALKFTTRNLPEVIEYVVKMACVETKEYDFDPFIERLMSAIEANFDDLVTILPLPSSFSIDVEVNFDPLGTPDEWLEAAENVRRQQHFGAYGKYDAGPAARSKMWKEKIFKVDRMGSGVPRKRKDGSEYDVSDKYVGRYTETIFARLNEVPLDKAPFWYFIEYGNADFGGKGDPFPSVKPTRMLENLRGFILRTFENALDMFKMKADVYLSRLLASAAEESLDIHNREMRDIDEAIQVFENAADLSLLRNQELDESNAAKRAALNEMYGIDAEYQLLTSRSGKKYWRLSSKPARRL